MYSLQEVSDSLDGGKLSDALYKLQRFADAQGLKALADWCSRELRGYGGSSQADYEAAKGYRTSVIQWRDILGRPIVAHPQMAFVNSVPIWDGVAELEGYTQDGIAYAFPDLQSACSGRHEPPPHHPTTPTTLPSPAGPVSTATWGSARPPRTA